MNHYQPEREIDPWIPEYDSDEQQDQNCLNQHSTEYQLQENQYDAIGKDLWKKLKRVSIPTFTTSPLPFRKSPKSHSWVLSCSLSNCQGQIRKKVLWTTLTNGSLLAGIRKSETIKIWLF